MIPLNMMTLSLVQITEAESQMVDFRAGRMDGSYHLMDTEFVFQDERRSGDEWW